MKKRYQAPGIKMLGIETTTPITGSITQDTNNPPISDEGEEMGAKKYSVWDQ